MRQDPVSVAFHDFESNKLQAEMLESFHAVPGKWPHLPDE